MTATSDCAKIADGVIGALRKHGFRAASIDNSDDATDVEKRKITPRYDEVYFRAIEAMDAEDDLGLLQLGFKVPNQPSIEEVNDWIIAHQDKQAFDTLYNALQEARDIIQRGIREGERGHKRALQQAAKILNEVT